jgi:arylsulfatase A-like enzyme
MKLIIRRACVIFPTIAIAMLLVSLSRKNNNPKGDDKQQGASKPNIIFILTDDQRWDALGAMGNTIIQTPNINKLANAGILFQNAYVTTSICCVSRASIMTGQYESRHQIHDFRTDLSVESIRNIYPALLKNAGYKTGFIGKFGIGAHPPKQLFDFWVNTEAGGLMQPTYITTDKNGNKIHDTDTIGHAIQQFLGQFGNKGPFCLSVSFKAPHEQDGDPPTYVIQPKYKDYYKEVMIPEPVTADPKYWNQFPDFFRTDTNFARARWRGLFNSPELYQENVKNYYRLVTGVDDVVGEMMKQLEVLGESDNTIIIFMGDNGMFLGEHGMEGKWFGYEESIRVPLIIYSAKLPDKIKQYKAPQIALNIDIAPTILAMAGITPPKTIQGIDLISLVENKIPEREDFFYQYYFLGGPRLPREEGVVTKDFKYMNFIEHDAEELFEIQHDPHETINLVNDSHYKTKLQALRVRYKHLKKIYGLSHDSRERNNKEF